MLHKITDGDKFVVYVDDKLNDEINEEALKMGIKALGGSLYKEEVNKIVYPNLTKEKFDIAFANVKKKNE